MVFFQYSKLLVGSIIIAILGLSSAALIEKEANMHIEPKNGTYAVGESFTVDIVIESQVAVNAFRGELFFDPDTIYVDDISYNTSIADLWAKRPWFSNGSGTINFIGGTTRAGGFIGTGKLLTITFTTLRAGDTSVHIEGIRILKHDGFGTDASLSDSLDTIFTVASNTEKIIAPEGGKNKSTLNVIKEISTTDLNNDGEQTMTDLSIFLGHFATRDSRGDINNDGNVNMTDMSIMLNAK